MWPAGGEALLPLDRDGRAQAPGSRLQTPERDPGADGRAAGDQDGTGSGDLPPVGLPSLPGRPGARAPPQGACSRGPDR